MHRRRDSAEEIEREVAMIRTAPIPSPESERAEVARMRRERQAAEADEQARARAYQRRADLYASYGPSMQPPPEPTLGPSGDFRVEFREGGEHVLTEYADDYGEALRKARDGLLGTSGHEARVFLGRDLVNTAHRVRTRVRGRGEKYVVRFAEDGERPRKLLPRK